MASTIARARAHRPCYARQVRRAALALVVVACGSLTGIARPSPARATADPSVPSASRPGDQAPLPGVHRRDSGAQLRLAGRLADSRTGPLSLTATPARRSLLPPPVPRPAALASAAAPARVGQVAAHPGLARAPPRSQS